MENDVRKLMDLPRKADDSLGKSYDSFVHSDGWHSAEQQKLMNDIAGAINIEEKDRY